MGSLETERNVGKSFVIFSPCNPRKRTASACIKKTDFDSYLFGYYILAVPTENHLLILSLPGMCAFVKVEYIMLA